MLTDGPEPRREIGRSQDALLNLGPEVGRGTIAEILRTAGLDPAPKRMNRTSWKEFLRTHWEVPADAEPV